MTELTVNSFLGGATESEESVTAAGKDETSLTEALENTLDISQDVKLTESAASEETDSGEKPLQEDRQQDGQRDRQQDGQRDRQQGGQRGGQQDGGNDRQQHGGNDRQQDGGNDRQQDGGNDRQQDRGNDRQQDGGNDRQHDGETASPPVAESSSAESKWVVGAKCQAVWLEDGRVYPATLVSVDGERCRVRFSGYGNQQDMDLSALRGPEAVVQTQRQNSQEWKPGSRCRAVYSEDGLVYPAVVLWVKGQRCCVRFNDYNNEEEQDVSSLLSPDELHGPSRASAAKGSNWKSSVTSSNVEWKRSRREERQQGERGGEKRREENHVGDRGGEVKEKLSSKVEKEAEEKKTGNQQTDGAEKLANHSFCFFPPFPPPPQSGSGGPVSFIPPPPPPLWTFAGRDSSGSTGVDASSSMLMLWYMCGFHTGSYMAQQVFKSSSKD
ncbi:serine/threonine-protein kinase prpf4B-like isoform X2 [Epinephelus fuscoguttatus]|uniref:serine/threonine-protein kinase prpf4B-like isoform X2 n=1 Tax=Epinephelus fuscoguttatus TaxID=293821 RepID=UPI0020D05607|nr:serine/threonine-protein kinase prpf4B-like isoform X2 [Epinephelus fuscoguttatus]